MRRARGFERAVDRLAAAGAVVEQRAVPEVVEAMDLAGLLFTAEAYGIWGEVIEAAPQLMFRPILERFRSGAAARAADYVAGWRRLAELRAAWAARVAGYDAVLVADLADPAAERRAPAV